MDCAPKLILTPTQVGIHCEWTNDSQRFLLENFDTICNSPAQIYHSALPFCPSSSWLHKYYSLEISKEVRVIKGLSAEWGVCSRTVSVHSLPQALICWKDTIAIGLSSGDIIILDAITGGQAAVLSGHSDSVEALSCSSDGTLLVSGGHDKTLKLWDVQTGGVIKTFDVHPGWVLSISISVDNTTIAFGSHDGSIYLWNIQTGQCHCAIRQDEKVSYVAFSPSEPQYLISVSGGTIQQWDINGHKMGSKYQGSHAVFSSDGTYIITSEGGVITIQNSDSRVKVAQFQAEDDIDHFCVSPDSKLVAVSTWNTIYIWDITSSDPYLIKTLARHTNGITSLSFSSSLVLVSVSLDESIMFWQVNTLSTEAVTKDPKFTPHTSAPITSVALEAKYGIATSCNSDGVVKTWDISTGLCRASFQIPNTDCPVDTQLIDGRLNLFWYANEKIHVWDVEKGEPPQTVGVPKLKVIAIRVSEDGSKVFCLDDKSVQVWSMLTGEIISNVEFYYYADEFLLVDGFRVWVSFPGVPTPSQGWDLSIPNSPPVPLPNTPTLHLNGTKHWDAIACVIKDTITGKVSFNLPRIFARPSVLQWGGCYLVVGSAFGEVLILDFSHVFPQ